MSPLTKFLDRHGHSLRQFLQFGLVGGAGVLVNMAVFAAANNVAIHYFGSHEYDRFFAIPGTDWSVRNYLVYSVVAFVVANLFNFVWNRHWTFRHGAKAPFLAEYGPFLLVGSVAQVVGLVLLQLLLNKTSPFYLKWEFFVDGAPFWRRRVYWAQFLQIILVMPVNFVVNKVWTFRHVRNRHAASLADREDREGEGGER